MPTYQHLSSVKLLSYGAIVLQKVNVVPYLPIYPASQKTAQFC